MVRTATTRELVTNEILLSLNRDKREKDLDNHHSSLLSALNVFLDFLLEYDRFLARSAGYDCDLALFMDSLDESGYCFTLKYDLVLPDQLYLGEEIYFSSISNWLVEMHLNLLADLDSDPDLIGLELFLDRAAQRAETLELGRGPNFSLVPTPWYFSRLERRYARMIETLNSVDGFLSLKIKKNNLPSGNCR